ncbi:MAG: Na/Pi cotransporter family protein [Pseudomonadota bacterium]
MDYHLIIFNTIGGLGLFIFGMRLMSEGLQHAAGDRMRKILETVSKNRVAACVTGCLVTSIIQSSSATTVMLVGFVNAGLMSNIQAAGVAIGANIGTTVTAQLIAFNATDAALPAIALGMAIKLFARKKRIKEIGTVLLGFGLLFYGMVVMKMGVSPLRESPEFIRFFTRFQADSLGGILLCVMTGALITMILQSSSATVGLTMTIASQGLLDLPGAMALVLGENIGTCITAELASIGTSVLARRTARANTMFNVLGVCYMVLLFPYYVEFIQWITSAALGLGPAELLIKGEKPNIARYIANAHTMFNVINTVVFLSLLPVLIKVSEVLVPSSKKDEDLDIMRPMFLEKQFIEMPGVALEQVRRELVRMGEIAEESMVLVIQSMNHRKLKVLEGWRHREEALDQLQREITDYLVRVSQGEISFEEAKEISSLMRMSNNLERIGDSVENVGELIEEMIENDLYLSAEGLKDYKEISDTVIEFHRFLIQNMRAGKKNVMDEARRLENAIDLMREEMRENHLARLRSGVCAIDPGLIFTDMLNQFEKIGDYCFNVAQAMAGIK